MARGPEADGRRGERFGRLDLLLCLAMVAAGAALHLPLLAAPFGTMEINGGNYFGVFARTWEKFGFAELRGVPIGPFELDDPAHGEVYFNHPPGFAWLCAALGTQEWQIRLPTAIGATLLGPILFRLLFDALGRWPAFAAGLLLMGVPNTAFYCIASYENAVVPLGLLMWVAFLRAPQAGAGAARRGWLLTLTAVSIVGPWMDMQYGFFCVGLLPLALSRDVKAVARRLALPWLASGASLGLVVAWAIWAAGSPRLPEGTDLAHLIENIGKGREMTKLPLGELLSQSSQRIVEGFGLPVLIAAGAGLIPLFRAAPRLAAAALIAGALNPLAAPGHSATHVIYWAYLGPLIAGACGALPLWGARGTPVRGVLAVALAAVVGHAWYSGVDHLRAKNTGFYRDYGEALTAAADPRAGGPPDRKHAVAYNTALRYGYYVRSAAVWQRPLGLEDLRKVEQMPLESSPYGVRYVLLQLEGSFVEKMPSIGADPALVEYLSKFPRESLPELERWQMRVPGTSLEARVAAVWLVTLVE